MNIMGIEKSVGAVVVSPSRHYLLLNRADKDGDFWEFPKGHQVDGEEDIQTLKRELKEEIGIENFELIKNFVGENNYISNSSGDTRIILLYLVKLPNDKIIVSGEHKSYVWATLDDALAKLNHNTWRKILINADKRLDELNA